MGHWQQIADFLQGNHNLECVCTMCVCVCLFLCVYKGGFYPPLGVIRKLEAESQTAWCLSESVARRFRGSGEHEWGILPHNASGSYT